MYVQKVQTVGSSGASERSWWQDVLVTTAAIVIARIVFEGIRGRKE